MKYTQAKKEMWLNGALRCILHPFGTRLIGFTHTFGTIQCLPSSVHQTLYNGFELHKNLFEKKTRNLSTRKISRTGTNANIFKHSW